MSDVLEDDNVSITHHFGAGVYIKEGVLRRGATLKKHTHSFDHLSVLCSGVINLTVDGTTTTLRGPQVIEIKAGQEHTVECVTSVTWLCVHATDETNPLNIDSKLIHEN